MTGIIGKKIGMTRLFGVGGESQAVTVLEAGPCVVTQVKTQETDGYSAVQVGFGEIRNKHVNRPSKGHFNKVDMSPRKYLMEFPLPQGKKLKPGEEVTVSIFGEGDRVTVKGVSKGRGFSGVIKRHGFSGGQKTHGQSDRLRAPGSIGQASDPSRVWPGTKMAGQYGNKTAVAKNLEIVKIDNEKHHLFIKGAVPGARNSLVVVTK
ncbi:MAG: 50S ribosomal protein L3 [Candidatus Neomarinimicrobiota bacterium]|nr:50S ribosomal protein L3 [Candidatus Neomarinimicrobiota bacterium]